jgi:hypothetical protein
MKGEVFGVPFSLWVEHGTEANDGGALPNAKFLAKALLLKSRLAFPRYS